MATTERRSAIHGDILSKSLVATIRAIPSNGNQSQERWKSTADSWAQHISGLILTAVRTGDEKAVADGFRALQRVYGRLDKESEAHLGGIVLGVMSIFRPAQQAAFVEALPTYLNEAEVEMLLAINDRRSKNRMPIGNDELEQFTGGSEEGSRNFNHIADLQLFRVMFLGTSIYVEMTPLGKNVAERLSLAKLKRESEAETPKFLDLLDIWIARRGTDIEALYEKAFSEPPGMLDLAHGPINATPSAGNTAKLADALELTGDDRVLFFRAAGIDEKLANI